IDRRENYVQRQQAKQSVEIPDVIDIKKPELAVEETLRRRERGVVILKPVDVLLHYQHADQARESEHAQQHDSETYRTRESQRSGKYRLARLRFRGRNRRA